MASQFPLSPRLSEMILIKDLAAKAQAPQCQYLWCSSFLKATKTCFLLWHPIYPGAFSGNHPLYYVFVITVFCLMNLIQAVRLWIMDLGELQEHNQLRFTRLCMSTWLSRQNLSRLSTLSSVLIFRELIKILTYRTLGWISHWTSVEHAEHLGQVWYCIRQHSGDIIFALNTCIFRKKWLSIKCHLHFPFMAWKFWIIELYLNGTPSSTHFVPYLINYWLCNTVQSKKNATAWNYAQKHFLEVHKINKISLWNHSTWMEGKCWTFPNCGRHSFNEHLFSIHVPAILLSVVFRGRYYRFNVWISPLPEI